MIYSDQITNVLLHNGTTKNILDIKTGDILIGPDSTPKHVKEYEIKQSSMVRVLNKKTESYYDIPDDSRIPFQLTNTSNKEKKGIRIKNTVYYSKDTVLLKYNEFLNSKKTHKHVLKMWSSPVIKFSEKNVDFPYFIGIWLGDGTSKRPGITTMDDEVQEYICYMAEIFNLKIKKYKKEETLAATYFLTTENIKYCGKEYRNPILNLLKDNNLIENKHIPLKYLCSSIEDRRELLAGLIDTDGTYNKHRNYYSITQKRYNLALDIFFLSKSLGFESSIHNYKGYYTVYIKGDIHEIPCRIRRKIPENTKNRKSSNRYAINIVNNIVGKCNYIKFEEECPLFLTGDFSVLSV